MKILLITFSVFIFLLFIRQWVGHGGYPEVWRLEEQIAQQNEENDIQAEHNRQLRASIDELKAGGDLAMEERARSELGMIKHGETFFQVILKEQQQEALPQSKNEFVE